MHFHRRHCDYIQETRRRMVVWLPEWKKGPFSCCLCGGAPFKCWEPGYPGIKQDSEHTAFLCQLYRAVQIKINAVILTNREWSLTRVSPHFALLLVCLKQNQKMESGGRRERGPTATRVFKSSRDAPTQPPGSHRERDGVQTVQPLA